MMINTNAMRQVESPSLKFGYSRLITGIPNNHAPPTARTVRAAMIRARFMMIFRNAFKWPVSQSTASFVRYGRITKPATRLITLVGMKIAP